MYLRRFLVRRLLGLYPALWRKEYGEEMRSMLLAQPLKASVIGDVFLNAARENLRRPDPLRIGSLILICWRMIWILWASISQLSPETWAPFVRVDCGLFLLVASSTACWTTIDEGEVGRGANAGFWSALLAVIFAPLAAELLLLVLAPDKTVPDWAFHAWDHFDNQHTSTHHDFVRIFATVLESVCGARLGYVIRRAKSSLTRQPFP